MSIRGLFRMLCCPPLPRAIVSQIAFWPPPSSYQVAPICNSAWLQMVIHATGDGHPPSSSLSSWQTLSTKTSRGNTIICAHLSCSSPHARYTILYSHENAVDIGQILDVLYQLGERLNCNVFVYDYSGYGASTGSPSERNLYSDAEAAWLTLERNYHIPPHRVIVYGSSIGSAAAVYLASQHRCACLVLQSALTSGMRVIFRRNTSINNENTDGDKENTLGCTSADNIGNVDDNGDDRTRVVCDKNNRGIFAGVSVGLRSAAVLRRCVCDPFPNIDRIDQVPCPVLVIHGTEDEVVGFDHGLDLYSRCVFKLPPLWIEGAGHCDIQLYEEFLQRMVKLVNEELPNIKFN